MNKIYTSLLLLLAISFSIHAQNLVSALTGEGGEYYFERNTASNPCITEDQYSVIEQRCAENRKLFNINTDDGRSGLSGTLVWPVQAASGLNDCGYHFIGAYVDQNTAGGSIQDYNCETNTYDGHRGTDIAAWPYSFYKMENNSVEVHAAAAGTIIDKNDGEFDRNCTSNTMTANYVIIQHTDGSITLYWHMKNGSITSVAIGQPVAAGDYLGIVGSSGSSSGPHLHFEVWSGTTNTTYKDPFYGACNTLNPSTWWISQLPHTNPAILKVSVNTTDLLMPGCPTTETPNESDVFEVPFQGQGLSPGYAKWYLFLREIPANAVIDLKILNPNGSTFNSWTYTPSTFYKVNYWGWSKLLPTTPGIYTFQATYNGIICSKPFTITTPVGINNLADLPLLQVLPNPAADRFSISGSGIENGNYTFILTNNTGQLISAETIRVENNAIENTISTAALSNGIYFLAVENEKSRVVKKIVVQK